MDSSLFEARYIDGGAGRMFCILHQPPAAITPRGAIVYVHPAGEEMNKARRKAALAARALAATGWWVLQPDLHGCGDSEGDFGDASWDIWLADVALASGWLRRHSGHAPVLWGLRAGCLLAAAAGAREQSPPAMIFWHPAVSGRLHLQQWLRMKVAGAMIGAAPKGGDGTRELRQRLIDGQAVEVGGYMISAALGRGLDDATLAPPAGTGRLAWLEVSNASPGEFSPAFRSSIVAWRGAGWQVDAAMVSGPPFWQTQEIEELPELVRQTVALAEGLCV